MQLNLAAIVLSLSPLSTAQSQDQQNWDVLSSDHFHLLWLGRMFAQEWALYAR